MISPLKKLTTAFIFTFGITPPRPEQEGTVAIFICAMILGGVLLVFGLGTLFLRIVLKAG